MTYYLSVYSLSDNKLYFVLKCRCESFPILGKNFPQSQLMIIRDIVKTTAPIY